MYLSRRQTLALVILLTFSAVGGGILIWRQSAREEVTVSAPAPEEDEAPSQAASAVVHVCGAVRNPGVYTLPAGSRIHEAIARAGGALPDADQEALNLAARVQDGEQIRLPRRGEAPPAPLPRVQAAASGDASAATRTAAAPQVRFPLSLNRSSAEELDAVPGIGPAIAARIVAYRQANGAFATVDDLLNVEGIGEKTLVKLRAYLSVP